MRQIGKFCKRLKDARAMKLEMSNLPMFAKNIYTHYAMSVSCVLRSKYFFSFVSTLSERHSDMGYQAIKVADGR